MTRKSPQKSAIRKSPKKSAIRKSPQKPSARKSPKKSAIRKSPQKPSARKSPKKLQVRRNRSPIRKSPQKSSSQSNLQQLRHKLFGGAVTDRSLLNNMIPANEYPLQEEWVDELDRREEPRAPWENRVLQDELEFFPLQEGEVPIDGMQFLEVTWRDGETDYYNFDTTETNWRRIQLFFDFGGGARNYRFMDVSEIDESDQFKSVNDFAKDVLFHMFQIRL